MGRKGVCGEVAVQGAVRSALRGGEHTAECGAETLETRRCVVASRATVGRDAAELQRSSYEI